jgi:hypothetical protein
MFTRLPLVAIACFLMTAALFGEDSGGAKLIDFRGIRIDKEKKTVTFPAVINMQSGMVEYLMVTDKGKTHESLLSTKIEPYDIQVAMLLLGIKPAVTAETEPPAQINKDYLAKAPQLKGENVNVMLTWKDGKAQHTARAEEMITDLKTNAAMTPGPWLYNGSEIYDGKFLAQVDGSIAAVVRDSAALMINPRPGNDDDQIWEVNTKATPKEGTAVDFTIQLEENTK